MTCHLRLSGISAFLSINQAINQPICLFVLLSVSPSPCQCIYQFIIKKLIMNLREFFKTTGIKMKETSNLDLFSDKDGEP